MSLWSRFRKTEPSAWTGEESENVLVISDIHLGEDILNEGPEALAGYIRALNRELADFIAYHRTHRLDGRRWHLVVNGDMFDFVKISARPEGSSGGRVATDRPEEPLDNSVDNTVWKLERILDVHKPLFKQLALLLMAGNRLTIIEGNHDTEFYFEQVRLKLTGYLVALGGKLHRANKLAGEFDPTLISRSIRFDDWFLASPGRYHIEHGHQYDEYCSFEYHLSPVESDNPDRVATPMTHRAMPYFAEILGDFSTHGVEAHGFLDWMRYAVSLGPRMLWVLARIYVTMVWELLGRAGSGREQKIGSNRAQHVERLEQLATQSPYGLATLERLDALTAKPAEFSLFKMVSAFYLDRFVLILLAAAALPFGLLMEGNLLLSYVGAVLGVSVAGLWLLSAIRSSDVVTALREAASVIADKTGARYIVFGHSHHPELVDLREIFGTGRFGEKSYYINSGSWVTREVLLGEEGRGMTFVEITGDGAALKRWLGAADTSEVLAATS